MSASKEKGSEAAATASKPMIVACGKSTPLHSAPNRCVATPGSEESETGALGPPVFECRKPKGYSVRAQFQSFKGCAFLDIRVWAGTGVDAIPTPKGATIPLERVRELGEALCGVALPELLIGVQTGS